MDLQLDQACHCSNRDRNRVGNNPLTRLKDMWNLFRGSETRAGAPLFKILTGLAARKENRQLTLGIGICPRFKNKPLHSKLEQTQTLLDIVPKCESAYHPGLKGCCFGAAAAPYRLELRRLIHLRDSGRAVSEGGGVVCVEEREPTMQLGEPTRAAVNKLGNRPAALEISQQLGSRVDAPGDPRRAAAVETSPTTSTRNLSARQQTKCHQQLCSH